ncbi:helix-turn-helix transcriptional regulator [Paraburkholderia sp. J76]|uniref:helix-turn-helix transcriptional regulator n=1 Tax=Paraburkholderia sp. J76 TaxID=2805439 RepID=UPI002ABE391A|nr:helix-turn-helix transcriptional regulator [Paraburkholderia sp. J76]
MSLHANFQRHVYSGFEPALAFDVVYGGTFEHRLLSSQRTTMMHQRLLLDELRLETGCYNVPMIAMGTMPRNAVCIGLMAQGGSSTRVNTTFVEEDEIQIYPSGIDLLYHASASSRWINFVVPEERLQHTAETYSGRPLDLPVDSVGWARLLPGTRASLTCLADDAMGLAASLAPGGGPGPELAAGIAQALLTGYVAALSNSSAAHSSHRLSTAQRHHHLILGCERLVIGGDTSIPLEEIARRSGYSLRSLELIFRRCVGTTPGRWFINMRLNGALRDLIMPGQTLPVSAIASKWGFRHLSRFSAQYRNAFGELPSDTLARTLRA